MSGENDEAAAPFPPSAPGGLPERVEKESRPSPIDVHVGTRIRLRRTLMGMSQERLGEAAQVWCFGTTAVDRHPIVWRARTN